MSPPRRARFLPTCLGDHFFAEAAADAVRLLELAGVEVEVVEGATCCGQPAWNAGHHEEAATMASYTADGCAGSLPVVLPSGSCAAMMRNAYPRLLGEDAAIPAVYELAEYLVDVVGSGGAPTPGDGADAATSGARPPPLRGLRVAYHHGCHALRELGVREAPLSLLRAAGAELVEWPAAEECCGFGGLFAVKLPSVSGAMADRKLETLPEGVDVLTSSDPGCLMQLGGRLTHRGSGDASSGSDLPLPRVVHLATLLREAWEGATGAPGVAGAAGAAVAGSLEDAS